MRWLGSVPQRVAARGRRVPPTGNRRGIGLAGRGERGSDCAAFEGSPVELNVAARPPERTLCWTIGSRGLFPRLLRVQVPRLADIAPAADEVDCFNGSLTTGKFRSPMPQAGDACWSAVAGSWRTWSHVRRHQRRTYPASMIETCRKHHSPMAGGSHGL